MSSHLARVENRIQLQRAAPFIPPLSLPGISDIVVTAALRDRLESEGFSGLAFQPLDKAHIVHLDVSSWNQSAPSPASYPESGEPEDYVLAKPHDPLAAASLGQLWELLPQRGGLMARQETGRRPLRYRFTMLPDSLPPVDVFRAENMRYVLVTERLRLLLDPVNNDALDFVPVELCNLPRAELSKPTESNGR